MKETDKLHQLNCLKQIVSTQKDYTKLFDTDNYDMAGKLSVKSGNAQLRIHVKPHYLFQRHVDFRIQMILSPGMHRINILIMNSGDDETEYDWGSLDFAEPQLLYIIKNINRIKLAANLLF